MYVCALTKLTEVYIVSKFDGVVSCYRVELEKNGIHLLEMLDYHKLIDD